MTHLTKKQLKAQQNDEQKFSANRYSAVDKIATEAGFDDDALVYTEFCLMPFFENIVEECAKVVERETGCKHSAEAIRKYSKMIGNQ